MLKSYVAFDLETTGLSMEENCIIEIGALKVREGRVMDRFITFVHPDEPVSAKITEITGITPEMVEDAPAPEVIIKKFVEFCEDDVLIGHNLMFDFGFTAKCAKRFGLKFEHKGLDTLKIARSVCPNMPSKSLGNLCQHFGIINSSAHRAYHDALATAKLYQTLAHFHEEAHPAAFLPVPLIYKEKKVQPATVKQINYLNELMKYHKIKCNDDLKTMTRSEISKKIDHIISTYGLPGRIHKG